MLLACCDRRTSKIHTTAAPQKNPDGEGNRRDRRRSQSRTEKGEDRPRQPEKTGPKRPEAEAQKGDRQARRPAFGLQYPPGFGRIPAIGQFHVRIEFQLKIRAVESRESGQCHEYAADRQADDV